MSGDEHTIKSNVFVLNNSNNELITIELVDLSLCSNFPETNVLFVIDISSSIKGLISSTPFDNFNKAVEMYDLAIKEMKPYSFQRLNTTSYTGIDCKQIN